MANEKIIIVFGSRSNVMIDYCEEVMHVAMNLRMDDTENINFYVFCDSFQILTKFPGPPGGNGGCPFPICQLGGCVIRGGGGGCEALPEFGPAIAFNGP